MFLCTSFINGKNENSNNNCVGKRYFTWRWRHEPHSRPPHHRQQKKIKQTKTKKNFHPRKMSAAEDREQKLVQEGISEYNFEEQEAEIAVESFLKEKRSGESFGQYLIRDGWVEGQDHQVERGDDSKYYLSSDSGLCNGSRGVTESEEPEDDDDIYSHREGLIAGLNASNHPAVRSKVGKDAKVSCVGTGLVHKDDRRFVAEQNLSHPSDLITAAQNMALEIDSEDRGNHETLAEDFLEEVITTAEKEFERGRDNFTEDHCARVVTEFLRHTEDKKRGEAVMAHTKAYVGNLQDVTSGIESDDGDGGGPPPIMRGIHRAPCRPARRGRSGGSASPPPRYKPSEARNLPKEGDPIGALVGVARHHVDSQEDEVWVSARNVAQMLEKEALEKTTVMTKAKPWKTEQKNTELQLFLSAWYFIEAIRYIPEVPSRWPPRTTFAKYGTTRQAVEVMLYRTLMQRKFPTMRDTLRYDENISFDDKTGTFDKPGFTGWKRDAFVKSETFFPIVAVTKREPTPHEAEAIIAHTLAGLMVEEEPKSEQRRMKLRRRMERIAQDHMRRVVPRLEKLGKNEGYLAIKALRLWMTWVVDRLAQGLMRQPVEQPKYVNNLVNILIASLENLMAKETGLEMKLLHRGRVVDRFDKIWEESNGGGPRGKVVTETFKNRPRVYQRTTQRIGGKMLALDKSRSVLAPRRSTSSKTKKKQSATTTTTTTVKERGQFNLREEMEAVAVDFLSGDAEKDIRKANPGTTIILLIPVKGSKAWKNMEGWVGSARRGLNDHVPSYIICKTGKFEFTSLNNDVYSAISKDSRDLHHVKRDFDVKFVDSKMQRVEYRGGGPTFHIAEADFGDAVP